MEAYNLGMFNNFGKLRTFGNSFFSKSEYNRSEAALHKHERKKAKSSSKKAKTKLKGKIKGKKLLP